MKLPPQDNSASTIEFKPRRLDKSRPLVSVVVPVYNEQECLPRLHDRLTAVLSALGGEYEILLIDDGSRDGSLEIIRGLAARDPHVGFRAFSRNFGHEAATTCGLLAAAGQTVVIIDADLQDPPEVIPQLLARWRQGYDLVYAQRRRRDGETALTRWTSHLFYRLLKKVSRAEMPLDTGDFRLMDRCVVDAFARLPERNRFVRGMISWTGYRQSGVAYDRDARLAGETKYGFAKRLALAFDAVCGLSTAPLKWITTLGAGVLIAGLLLSAGLVSGPLTGVSSFSATGLLAAALFTLSGVQLLSLGLLGEYVGRIYTEVQARPLFLVAEQHDATAAAQSPARRSAG